MGDELQTTESNSSNSTTFANVLVILADKLSRKAAVIGMAMLLIYLLEATPNVSQRNMPILAITGLAMFFTILQWIIDLKYRGDKLEEGVGENKKESDSIESKLTSSSDVTDGGADYN